MAALTREQLYCFDTFGYLILRNALSSEFVQRLHSAFDANVEKFVERTGALKNGRAAEYQGTGRLDAGNLFGWEKPHCDPFRELLVHPALVPVIKSLCGPGYRLDHLPLALRQLPSAEGFDLHGGVYQRSSGRYLHELAYSCHNREPNCRLLAMSVAMTDTNEGEGGYVLLPGSHKSNFPLPESIESLSTPEFKSLLKQPVLAKGDVLFFTEALSHGAIPLKKESERRLVLYRFGPPNTIDARGTYDLPDAIRNDLTDAQRAVVEKPYGVRFDRKQVDVKDGKVVVEVPAPRSAEKKAYDKEVFNSEYF
eukprot:gene494-1040_t